MFKSPKSVAFPVVAIVTKSINVCIVGARCSLDHPPAIIPLVDDAADSTTMKHLI